MSREWNNFVTLTDVKTALITGIHKGIGHVLAEKFLAEGWAVYGSTRDGVSDIEHENLHTLTLDLMVPHTISEAADFLRTHDVHSDALVNNAGILIDEDEPRVDVPKMRETFEVNVFGTIDFTERVVPLMHSGSHIVNITSAAGQITDIGSTRYPAYRISKCTLNMYTRILALQLAPKNICVSAVHPGWVQTDMGGENAPVPTPEAADDIFQLAIQRPETGLFWHKGKRIDW